MAAGGEANPTAVVMDSRTRESRPASGHRCADEQVKRTAKAVQKATGQSVGIAYVDQGYTGEQAQDDLKVGAEDHGIMLHVVKLPKAKRGFVLLPRRWVVERSFAWMTRFRRLAKDFERLPKTVAGLHFAVFACILLARCFAMSA